MTPYDTEVWNIMNQRRSRRKRKRRKLEREREANGREALEGRNVVTNNRL